MTPTPRRGWRERLEPGIYRNHRVGCPSSSDQRPGRRCGCPVMVVIKRDGRHEWRTLDDGATLAAGRRARAEMATRPRAVVVRSDAVIVRDFADAYFRAVGPMRGRRRPRN